MNNQSNANMYKPQGNGMRIADLIKPAVEDNVQKNIDDSNEPIHIKENESVDNNKIIYYGKDKQEEERKIIKPILRKKRVYINENENEYIENNDRKIYQKENDYLKTFLEFILLLTLFVIMSQPFVIKMMSSYIQQLNPSDDDQVPFSGILIYGLLLSLLFFASRNLLLGKMNINY